MHLQTASEVTDGNERLFSTAFHYAPVGIALVSPEGFCMKVNAALCRLLGYPEEEFEAMRFQDITHRDDRGAGLSEGRRLLAGEAGPYEVEKRFIHRDGAEVPVLLSVAVVRNPAGTPDHFIALFHPMRSGMGIEESVDRERRLLASLMGTSPDHIYFKDTDSRFIRINEAKARRHGMAHPDEAIGKSDFDFFEEEHAWRALAEEQELLRTGRPILDKEERLNWPNGDVSWVSSTKVARRDARGRIVGLIGISRDITERKTAELEREHLNGKLIEISRRAGMSEVATSVLHNVGNVLNSVNISCSVISEKVRHSRIEAVAKTAALLGGREENLIAYLTTDPQGQRLPRFLHALAGRLAGEQKEILEELNLLDRNIDHITQIINVQQSYANVGGMREALPVAELVEDALRMNSVAMTRHQIILIREYGEVPLIVTEKHRVLQILVNLIRNAKHALTGCAETTERCITLRIAMHGADEIAVSVGDNGMGIARENLTRVFGHGFTTKSGGHGFGLHSGALAAQDLGGTLSVHSDGPGTGATFTLILPTRPPAEVAPKS